jgi:hypothetical protein
MLRLVSRRTAMHGVAAIEKLVSELEDAQEHVVGPYYEEAVSDLVALTEGAPAWTQQGGSKVCVLAGQCAVDGEYKILRGDGSGWLALERSRWYWGWVHRHYAEWFPMVRCAVVLAEHLAQRDRDCVGVQAEILRSKLQSENSWRGHAVDDFCRFCLRLANLFMGENCEMASGSSVWDGMLGAWKTTRFESSLGEACDEHLRLATHLEGPDVFYRGEALYAPELRAVMALRRADGKPVNRGIHPLLALPFDVPMLLDAAKDLDPVMGMLLRQDR